MQPPDVNRSEQKAIEAKGFKNFSGPPDETGLSWVRRKKDGACFFLDKNDQCAIYSVHPAICKIEPFTIVDYDCEEECIELELNFPFSSCCPGVGEKGTLPLDEIGKAARIIVKKILDLTAKDLGLPITDKRVHVETRSRLLRRNVEAADLQL